MNGVRGAVLTVRFLMELALLALGSVVLAVVFAVLAVGTSLLNASYGRTPSEVP